MANLKLTIHPLPKKESHKKFGKTGGGAYTKASPKVQNNFKQLTQNKQLAIKHIQTKQKPTPTQKKAKQAVKAQSLDVRKVKAISIKQFAKKPVKVPNQPCPLLTMKQKVAEVSKIAVITLAREGASNILEKYITEPAVKYAMRKSFKPDTVKGAANLIKAAGKGVKPLARKLSPELAKTIGRATNKGTVNAVGKSLRVFAKTSTKVVGAMSGGLVAPIVESASRFIDGKPLFTKPALFHYGASVVKGAFAGAIAGSVVPGLGTVAGFAAGLVIGVAVDKGIEYTGAENYLMKRMGIQDD